MAAVTRTLRIGSTVTPLPGPRPRIVARQAATVSRLSGGRAVVGVGLGSDESGDFSRFGEESDLRVRVSMLTEAVDIMRCLWAGTPCAPAGEHCAVDVPAAPAEPHPDGVDLSAMAEAGATWWMESLGDWDPLEPSMQVVDAGPP